jgi:beta-galactosidase
VGYIKGICNGDATSLQLLTSNTMKAFNGQLVLVVQSALKKGNIKIEAASSPLSGGTIALMVK